MDVKRAKVVVSLASAAEAATKRRRDAYDEMNLRQTEARTAVESLVKANDDESKAYAALTQYVRGEGYCVTCDRVQRSGMCCGRQVRP